MTPTDNTDLRDLALAAKQTGDWYCTDARTSEGNPMVCDDSGLVAECITDEDAAYISACHPARIIGLVDECEGLRDEVEELAEMLRDLVMLDAEANAIRGGGPGWRERHDKAMARAAERFMP